MKKVDIFPEALFSSLIDIPMFSQIDPSDLGDLPGICDLFSFEPGERIIKEGEMSSSLFTLLSGEVEILKKGHQKEDIVINSLTNGTVFGETSLFKNQPSTATVRPTTLRMVAESSTDRILVFMAPLRSVCTGSRSRRCGRGSGRRWSGPRGSPPR